MINYFTEFKPVDVKIPEIIPLDLQPSNNSFNLGSLFDNIYNLVGNIFFNPIPNYTKPINTPVTKSNSKSEEKISNLVKWINRGGEGRYNRGNLRAEILDLFQKELGWVHDKDFHLGDAIRKRGVNYGSKTSNHFEGNAVDLTPRGAMTFDKMMSAFLGNDNIKKFFRDNHIGILEETTKDVLAKTRGTGPHFHIGPDKWAVDMWNKRLSNYVPPTTVNLAKLGGKVKLMKDGGSTIIDEIKSRTNDFIEGNKDLLDKLNINSLFKGIDPIKGVEAPEILNNIITPVKSFFSDKMNDLSEFSSKFLQLFNFNNTPIQQPTSTKKSLNSEQTVKLAGYDVPKSWIEMKWNQESSGKIGEIDERHRKGIVVRDNNGKADTKEGYKTYGPGLLYHPETGKLMQDMEPPGGFTKEELTRLFYVHLEKVLLKGREIGCKNWNQAAAYGGVIGNFGEHAAVSKKLRSLILSGASDDLIFNHIAHASDRLRYLFPGLITRRMWEARTWKGDFDPKGYLSSLNKQITKQLNPG